MKNTSWLFENILGINPKKLIQENTTVNVFGQIIKFTEAEEEAIVHQEWQSSGGCMRSKKK